MIRAPRRETWTRRDPRPTIQIVAAAIPGAVALVLLVVAIQLAAQGAL